MGTRHWPEDANEAIEELEKKLDTELKRVNALLRLRESYEKELDFYRKQHYNLSKERLDKLEESLISEKVMNEILTNENSELLNLSKWISVEDELPSVENETLICTDAKSLKNYIPATDEIFGAVYYKGKWLDAPMSDYPYEYNVTYWMPLPKGERN